MTKRNLPIAVVAGGAGFVGSHLCEALLKAGMRVICLDNMLTGRHRNLEAFSSRPEFDFIEADIVDPLPARVLRVKPNLIFNLACAASPPHYQADPEHTMMTSVLGTRRLLTFAEKAGARLLQASTSEVYGDPNVHPQTENYWGNVNPTGPRACYDEGKRAAESLCFDFLRAGRAHVRVARIFNTYGPRMRADDGRVISNVITQALTGADITVYGTGEQTRSFCYVDDLVRGLLALMRCERADSGPVNLGNPAEMTVRELVTEVLRLTSSQSRVVSRPLPIDDPQRRRPDIARAKSLLGWAPRVSLVDGLKATIAYFEAELALADKPAATMPYLAPGLAATPAE
jgi:UDP-glucuronate decarboxylase